MHYFNFSGSTHQKIRLELSFYVTVRLREQLLCPVELDRLSTSNRSANTYEMKIDVIANKCNAILRLRHSEAISTISVLKV